jgi:hypothetical protein
MPLGVGIYRQSTFMGSMRNNETGCYLCVNSQSLVAFTASLSFISPNIVSYEPDLLLRGSPSVRSVSFSFLDLRIFDHIML